MKVIRLRKVLLDEEITVFTACRGSAGVFSVNDESMLFVMILSYGPQDGFLLSYLTLPKGRNSKCRSYHRMSWQGRQ